MKLKKDDPSNKTKENENGGENGRKKRIPWEHNVDILFDKWARGR